MMSVFDVTIARVMVYCLCKFDGLNYQQISKQMGYSDGVTHKFASGTPNSKLYVKCVRDFFNLRGSEHSKAFVLECSKHPEIFGGLMFEGIAGDKFLRVIELISKTIDSGSNGGKRS
jgi:hypothetical protein